VPLHIVFVADYGEGCIEVSDRLPEPRRLPDVNGIPCFRGYRLTRLRIDAYDPPVLPEGDLTEEQYREWRSILGEFTEEAVDRHLAAVDLAGVCVEVKLAAVDAIPHGTLLEARVKNVGPYPAGKIQVAWHGQWDKPRETGESGRGFHFVSVGPPPRELPPGAERTFALLKNELRQCLGYAAALSPEQFYIAVSATKPGEEAYYEVARVPGTDLGYMVEQLEHFLETEEPQ
jgi:hypothetical protein